MAGVGYQPPPPPIQIIETSLDEPIYTTLWRDVRQVLEKIFHVLVPRVWSHKSKGVDALRDWDLWGPLMICLALAILLFVSAPDEQGGQVFAAAFVIPWLGAGVITVNSVVLGGKMSFFQSVCLLGYCVFPLMVSAFLVKLWGNIVYRAVLVSVCFVWSTASSIGFFAGMVPPNRKALATYPVFLFYMVIAWMILSQK